MINETPVMFEFEGEQYPLKEGLHAVGGEESDQLDIRLAISPEAMKRASRLTDFYKAKLKDQGWLSPEDQQPFCMVSAKSLGVNPVDYEQVGVFEAERVQFTRLYFKHGNGGMYIEDMQPDRAWKANNSDPVAFDLRNKDGALNINSMDRYEKLGVNRYEKVGE
jgi:hypothetical protein